MKVVQETTEWTHPNHVYFLNDARNKMVAYVRWGTAQIQEFKKPISFYTTGRRFREVPNLWNFVPKDLETPQGRSWTVAGSKGAEYTVTEYQGEQTCSCSGFKFRGKCRHTELVK